MITMEIIHMGVIYIGNAPKVVKVGWVAEDELPQD